MLTCHICRCNDFTVVSKEDVTFDSDYSVAPVRMTRIKNSCNKCGAIVNSAAPLPRTGCVAEFGQYSRNTMRIIDMIFDKEDQ